MTQIEAAVQTQILPKSAAKRLEVFLTSGCSPLPANIDEALINIIQATGKVRLLDAKNQAADPRRLKRYEDIARIIQSLKNLMLLMKTTGIGPIYGTKKDGTTSFASRPLYVALDLGLRQKRKHYNGQLFFQAIVLPDNFFDADARPKDSSRKAIPGLGTKVAEGGRYDDLVRDDNSPDVILRCCIFLVSLLILSIGSEVSSSRELRNSSCRPLYCCTDSNGE